MTDDPSFVDIHCHLLPGIDDGAASWDESLEMARMAADDGIRTVVVTPHQLGSYAQNDGATIRSLTAELQRRLTAAGISLNVLPGADVRIEEDLLAKLKSGDVLTLADRGLHVLLELPHEMYFPLEPLLERLRAAGMVGVLSHPERNEGLLADPRPIEPLIRQGCLMQITAGSLMGSFGPPPQQMAEWMLSKGLVHFVATDAHGVRSRRPLMSRAFHRVEKLIGREAAVEICCRNPALVAEGRPVDAARLPARRKSWFAWLTGKRAG